MQKRKDMAKRVVEEDLGESWEMYKKALGTDNAEPDGQGSRLPVPGEGERISPSPSSGRVPADMPVAKGPSRKTRRKSVSKKAASMDKSDVRLTVLFPEAVIQQVKIVALVERRSVSEIVREAVAGYVDSVISDCVRSLPIPK